MLLGYVRLGYGPHEVADSVGTTKRALEAFLRLDPFKAEQYEDARGFWKETVERKLHKAVDEGEPWAISMTLKAEMEDKYGAKTTQATTYVVASAADLARLIEMAEKRPLPSGAASSDTNEPSTSPEPERHE